MYQSNIISWCGLHLADSQKDPVTGKLGIIMERKILAASQSQTYYTRKI